MSGPAFRGARGSGLVMSLIVLAVFAMLGVVIYTVTRTQAREAAVGLRTSQAQAAAEAGLEDALEQLYQSSSWNAGFSNKPFGSASYTVVVSSDSPPWIVSVGAASAVAGLGSVARSVRAQASVTASTAPQAGSGYAIMAQTEARSESLVDAYSSAVNPSPTSFSSGADVWSNGIVVTSTGAVRIRGSATYRSAPAPSASTIEGTVFLSTYTQTLPNHTCNPCKNANSNLTGLSPQSVYNSGSKNVAIPVGTTALLQPGTYYFNNISIAGTLNVNASTGTVTVYYSGVITANSGCQFNNLSQIPSNLLLYGEKKGNTHLFQCATPLHAFLEEPTATFEMHQAFYGRIWGSAVRIRSDGALHYDTGAAAAAARVSYLPGSWSESYLRR